MQTIVDAWMVNLVMKGTLLWAVCIELLFERGHSWTNINQCRMESSKKKKKKPVRKPFFQWPIKTRRTPLWKKQWHLCKRNKYVFILNTSIFQSNFYISSLKAFILNYTINISNTVKIEKKKNIYIWIVSW